MYLNYVIRNIMNNFFTGMICKNPPSLLLGYPKYRVHRTFALIVQKQAEVIEDKVNIPVFYFQRLRS